MRTSLLLGLFACLDKPNETEDTGVEIEETDTGAEDIDTGETDPDTGETDTDTDETDTDTGDTIIGTPITLALTGGSGMKIGLVQVVFPQDDGSDTGEDGDDGPEFRNSRVLSSELTNETTFTFGVETPEDSELDAIIPGADTLMGLWAPFLFEDSNGDDEYNEGEAIAGFSMTWLVYSTADIPEYTVSSGWGALEMTFTEEPPTAGDITNIPLAANLQAANSITIGGSYDTSLGDRRIAIAAAATFESTFETMEDIVASDPWTLTLSGVPAENHFMDLDSATAMAMGVGLVYEDFNGSGAFELDDLYNPNAFTPSICYDGMGGMGLQPVSIVYSQAPTDMLTAMYSGMYGLGVGWSVMISMEDVPIVITGNDLNNLIIDENCMLE